MRKEAVCISMRKGLSVIMIAVIMTASMLPAYAEDTYIDEDASVYYLYTAEITTGLIISSSGTATATTAVIGEAGLTTKIVINMYLEKYNSGTWDEIAHWSKTSTSCSAQLSKTKTVSSGNIYRVRTEVRSYAGTKYEDIMRYSHNVQY
jgi:hypothetical protein